MGVDVEAELQRIRTLLGPSRAGDLAEVDPLVPAGGVGADAALGLRSEEPEAFASVYIFASGGGRARALDVLHGALPNEGDLHVLDAVNGPSLFFGYARIDGEGGIRRRFRLNDMVSAFAGDE